MKITKESSKVLIFLVMVILFSSLGLGLSVSKDNLLIGEYAIVLMGNKSYSNISIHTPTEVYNFLGESTGNLTFMPRELGNHSVRLVDSQGLIKFLQFFVGDEYYGNNVTVSTLKKDYLVGDEVLIKIEGNKTDDFGLEIKSKTDSYRFLGLVGDLLSFVPAQEGEYNVSVTFNEKVVSFFNFNVSLLFEEPQLSTSQSEYYIEDEVKINVNNIHNRSFTMKIFSDKTNLVLFEVKEGENIIVPRYIGNYTVELKMWQKTIARTKFSIVERRNATFEEIVEKLPKIVTSKNETVEMSNIVLKKDNESVGDVLQGEIYDVEINFTNSKVKKIKINDLKVEQEIDLGIEDVDNVSVVNSVDAFAIDPTNLNFTNATVTSVAKGNELYKCVEWNFSTQTCYGNWSKVMDIVPGEEYDFVIDNLDPGFVEIFITDAAHLNESKVFIEDIYDNVSKRDGIWKTIPQNNYVRITFEKPLTFENDITVYARSNSSGRIEVYEWNSSIKIADFETISVDSKYQILLTNLSGSQDTFDLKIVDGDVDFDYIVDPITELHFADFDSASWDGWTDGGTDTIISTARSVCTSTVHSVQIVDDAETGYIEQSFDFTGYDYIMVKWSAYYTSLENDNRENRGVGMTCAGNNLCAECMEFSVDGSILKTWGENAGSVEYFCDVDVTEDTWLDETSGSGMDQFMNLTCGVDITCDSDVTIRFEAELSGNADYVYIDCINISGYWAPPSPIVNLNNPTTGNTNDSLNVNFTYTPEIVSADFLNCTLWNNESGWSGKGGNLSTIINDSVNGINYTFSSDGNYVWNVQCINEYEAGNFSDTNYTINIDTVPDITSTVSNNGPKKEGESITFTGTCTNPGDNFRLLVCNSTATGCNATTAPGDILCEGVDSTTTSPSCSLTTDSSWAGTQSGFIGGCCDDADNCDSGYVSVDDWDIWGAPLVVGQPSDLGSGENNPTTAGEDVVFNITANDPNNDDYYILVCNNNETSGGSCSFPGVSYCVSGLVSSGVHATCNHNTLGEAGSYTWYAFTCDNASEAVDILCSSGKNGTLEEGSPYKVNNRPYTLNVSVNTSFVKTGDSLLMYTVGGGDSENDDIRLQCGNESGNYNLCVSSYGQPERNCSFVSPWVDNMAHSVYCVVNDSFAVSFLNITNITSDNINPDVYNVGVNDSDSIVSISTSIWINLTAIDSGAGIDIVNSYNDSIVPLVYQGNDEWGVATTASSLGCLEGNCTIHFDVWDRARNLNDTYYLEILVDNGAPNVTNVAINDSDAIIRTTDLIQVNVTVTDTNSVVNVTVENNSIVQMYNIPSTSIWSANVTSGDLGCIAIDGLCTLHFKGYDVVGNVNDTVFYDITIDDLNPNVTNIILNDSDNKVKSSDIIQLNVTVTDSNLVVNVTVKNNSIVQMYQIPATNIWSTNLSMDDLGCLASNGECMLHFTAIDIVGNINNTENITIVIDDVFPAVSNVAINDSDNVLTSISYIQINVTVTDTNSVVNVTVENNSIVQMYNIPSTNIWSANVTSGDLGCIAIDGLCTLHFKGYDVVGNVNDTEYYVITIDDLNPGVESITSNMSVLRSTDSIKINVSIKDKNAIYNVSVNGTISLGMNPVNVNLFRGDNGQLVGTYDAAQGSYINISHNDNSYWYFGSDVLNNHPDVQAEIIYDTNGISQNDISSLNFSITYCHGEGLITPVGCDGSAITGDVQPYQNVSVYDFTNLLWVTIGQLRTNDNANEITDEYSPFGNMADYVNDTSGEIKIRYRLDYINQGPFKSSYLIIDEAVLDVNLYSCDNTSICAWEIETTPASLGCIETNGNCTLTFFAQDIIGNINKSEKFNITIDDAPPLVHNISINDSDNVIGSLFYVNITVNTSDVSGVANVSVNGSYLSLGELWHISDFISNFGCSEGYCILGVSSIDGLGNINSTEFINITIDDTQPGINLVEPVNGFNTSSTSLLVNFTTNDNFARFLSCNVILDDVINNTVSIETPNGAYGNHTIIGLSEGDHLFNVSCSDDVPNINYTETRQFTVDLSSPIVYLKTPTNNTLEVITKTITFEYNTTDDILDVESCSLVLNGQINGVPDNDITENTTLNFVRVLSNGDYNWSVNCTDTVGRVGESSFRNLSIQVSDDISSPFIDLNSPVNNDYLDNESVNFTFTPSDGTGISSCSLILDGGVNATCGTVSLDNFTYKREINITENSNTSLSEYQIQFRMNTYSLISSGKMKGDCSDIRFADENEVLIPYYIDEGPGITCNTPNTLIWLQVPNLGANSTEKIYMYYDSSTASSLSNLERVFTYSKPKEIYYAIGDYVDTSAIDIISYSNDNIVTLTSNGEATSLNRKEIYTGYDAADIADGDSWNVTGPLSFGCITANCDIPNPISFAGKEFIEFVDRGGANKQWYVYAPFANASVYFYNSTSGGSWDFSNPLYILNATPGVVYTVIDADGGDDQVFWINSTTPVLLAFEYSSAADTRTHIPAGTDRWGINEDVGFAYTGTQRTLCTHVAACTHVTRNGPYAERLGGNSDGLGTATHINASLPFGQSQTADGDGGESMIYWPEEELSLEYLTPVSLQYIAGALTNGSTCILDNVTQIISTGLVAGGFDYPNPKKIYHGDGTSSPADAYISAGASINCTEPFFLSIEPDQDEEANILSWKQARQYQYPEPSYILGDEQSNAKNGGCYIANGELSYFSVEGVNDGLHDWYINCTDNSSNYNEGNSSLWNFTVDTIKPADIKLESPLNFTIRSNVTPTFSWNKTNETNFYRYHIQIDDVEGFSSIDYNYYVYDINTNWYHTSIGTDKAWYWRVNAIDLAGNNFTSNFYVYITDNTNPIVSLIIPNDNTWNKSSSIGFTYSATDLYLANCTLYGNFSGTWGANQTNQTVSSGESDTFNAINLNDGFYLWNVYCEDNASNIGFDSNYSLYIDSQQPSIILNNPINNSNTSETNVEFNITGIDNLAETLLCNISLNGVVNKSVVVSNNEHYTTTILGLNEGENYWSVLCQDNATNLINSETWRVNVDLTSPIVNLELPYNNTNYESPGFVELSYNASDLSTISNCSLYFNSTLNQTNNTIVRNTSMFFRQYLGGGDYLWKVACIDNVGREGESDEFFLSIAPPRYINVMSNYGESIDRDKVNDIVQDNTSLIVKLSDLGEGVSVDFKANLTNPYILSQQNILLGTSLSNSSGHAVLNFSGLNSVGSKVYAGNFTWWAEATNYIVNGSSTVLVFGGLNVSFRFEDELPDLIYGSGSEAGIHEFLKSLGPESDKLINGTYLASVNTTLVSPNGTNYTVVLIDPDIYPEPSVWDRYKQLTKGIQIVKGEEEIPKLKSRIVNSNNWGVRTDITFIKERHEYEKVRKDSGLITMLENWGWKASPRIQQGRYDIDMNIRNNPVQRIVFEKVNYDGELNLGIDELNIRNTKLKNETVVSGYAIDPSQLNFTTATATIKATGTMLYKCANWNFSEQECKGEWKKVMKITPGQDYNITIDAKDPGFMEINISIVNVQSYPMVGGQWEVKFQTYGESSLRISGHRQTKIDNQLDNEDLRFLVLKCGEDIVEYDWINNSVYVANYSCSNESSEISKVNTRGKHDLKFEFGEDVGYARNYAYTTEWYTESGKTVIAEGDNSVNITLDKDVQVNKSFLIVESSGLNPEVAYADEFQITGHFLNGSIISIQRYGNPSGAGTYLNVSYFVVEGSDLNVEHGEIKFADGATRNYTQIVNSVDVNKTVLMLSSRSEATNNNMQTGRVTGNMSNSTWLFVRRNSTASYEATVKYSVVEFGEGVSIQQGYATRLETEQIISVPITQVNMTRTWVYFKNDASDVGQGDVAMAGGLLDDSNLEFRRWTAPSADYGTTNWYYYVITMPLFTHVYHGNVRGQSNSGSATEDLSLTPNAVRNRSFAYVTNSHDGSGTSGLPRHKFINYFTTQSDTVSTLRSQRFETGQEYDMYMQVIQLPEQKLPPNVTNLTHPFNLIVFNQTPVDFNFTVIDVEDSSLPNCSLWGNFSGIWAINTTITSVSVGDVHNISISPDDGNYMWNVQCFDNDGEYDFFDSNYSFDLNAKPKIFTLANVIENVSINQNITFYANCTNQGDSFRLLICDDDAAYCNSSTPSSDIVCEGDNLYEGHYRNCTIEINETYSGVNVGDYATCCDDGGLCDEITSSVVDWEVFASPYFIDGPTDSGSSQVYPTLAGDLVNFTANVTDYNGDNYKFLVCNSSVLGVGLNCESGNELCSSSAASGDPTHCTYLQTDGQSGNYSWWSFLCDLDSPFLCSEAFNGTGLNGSPYYVNNNPEMTNITSSSYLVKNGDLITISSQNATDLENDTLSLICGNESGNYNLCSGGFGYAERDCSFVSPWVDDVNHIVYCVLNDSFALSLINTTIISSDNTAPIIGLSSPSNDSVDIDGVVQFSYYLNETNVDVCQLYGSWNGWGINQTNTTPNHDYTNIFETVNLNDGVYTWNVYCNDTLGQGSFNLTNYTITVDTTPPVVTLPGPNPGLTWESSSTVVFNYEVVDTITDIAQCDLIISGEINSTDLVVIESNPNEEITTELADGVYDWSINCTDSNGFTGNSSTQSVTIAVANNPPSAILIGPDNNGFVGSLDVYFEYYVDDDKGTDNCSVYLDDVLNKTNSTIIIDANNNMTIFNISEGKHNWSVECIDNIGQGYNTSTQIFYVDITSPGLNIEDPLNNTLYTDSDRVLFHYNLSDNIQASLANCSLYIQDTLTSVQYNVPQSSSQEMQVTLSNADYFWRIECYDRAGNYNISNTYNLTVNSSLKIWNGSFDLTGKDEGVWNLTTNAVANWFFPVSLNNTRNLTLDLSSPNITLVFPEDNYNTTNLLLTFIYNVTDSFTNISNCSLYVDDSLYSTNYTISSGDNNFTANLTYGNHNWSIGCYDFVGNFEMSNERTIFVRFKDLFLNFTDIVFSTNTPVENQDVEINITLYNIGDENITENFYVNITQGNSTDYGILIDQILVNGLYAGNNLTVSTNWTALIGTYTIYAILDSFDNVFEQNESNNVVYKNISILSYQFYYGDVITNLFLDNSDNTSLYSWVNDSESLANIFIADADSQIDWSNLEAIGVNASGGNTTNDFSEIDGALNISGNSDSVSNIWAENDRPKQVKDIEMQTVTIYDVPISNSTNNTNFITGIMWDKSDNINGEYNGTQDLLFVTTVNNSMVGQFGIYDYEIKVPSNLKKYVQPNVEEKVILYTELK